MPFRLLYIHAQGVFDCFDHIPVAAAQKSRIPWAPGWNIANFNGALAPNCHLVIAAHGNRQGTPLTADHRVRVSDLANRVLQRITQRNHINRVTYLICHAAANMQPLPGIAQLGAVGAVRYAGNMLSVDFMRPNAVPPVQGANGRPEEIGRVLAHANDLIGWQRQVG